MNFLKGEKYFFINGEKIEELNYEEDNEKYLTDDNSSEAKIVFTHFFDDQNFCLNKDFRDKNKNHYLGELSKLAAVIPMYLYTAPEYIKKYPNGIYTDGILLLPLKSYHDMLEDEFVKDIKAPQIFFLKALTSVIEGKYNVKFTDDELSKIIEYTFDYAQEPYKELLKNKIDTKSGRIYLEFVNGDNFVEQLKLDGFSDTTINRIKEFRSSGDYIDHILSNAKEVNDPNHPFYKIKDKIVPINLTFCDNEKNDIIKQLEEAKSSGKNQLPIFNSSADSIVKTMNWLDEIAENKISSILNNNGSAKDVADGLNEYWIPLIYASNSDKIFRLGLSNLVDLVSDKFPDIDENFYRELHKAMGNTPYYYYHYNMSSDFLIRYNSIHDKFDRPRIEVLDEKEHQYREKYFENCSNGSIENLKEFLSNPKFDFSVEDHKGFLMALKHGNIEVIDYFLNAEVLKEKLPEFYKHVLDTQNSYDEKTVGYFYSNEKISTDLNILGQFAEKYIDACKKNSPLLVNKLNTFPGAENLLYEKIEGLRTLCSIKNPDLDLVKDIMDHISPMINRVTCANTKSFIDDKLRNCLRTASEHENYDVCRYFIFDYNLKIDQEYIDFVKLANNHKFEEVEKFLALRELNASLNKDLNTDLTGKVKKPKL
jgi:hypothetical protein